AGLSVLLANPALAPVSAAASVSGKGGPNCAGPYRIERSRDGLRLVRDPDYHTGNAAFEGNGRGHVATIVIKEFASTDEAYDALMAGRVDAAPVPESRVAEAEVDPVRVAGHARRGTSEITYLAFDPSLVPTSNPVFRRAVSLALDRVALVDAAFGDRRPPATRWLVGAPDRPAPRSCDAGAQRVADRDRARKLLAANGIDAATFKLPLLFDPARTSPLVVQAIEAQLEDNLGLTVRPKPTDTPDFDAALAAARSVPKLWVATAPGGYGVPEQVLEALFRTGSPDNTNRFSDPRVDELIDRGRRADDTGERDRAYTDAEGRVCDLMPDVPLWTGVSHWAFDSKKVAFGGSSPIDAFGGLLLREARVR
ncbi:MAG TPA: ABC transporter substrate-binding protein, partial [Actinomycetota bacterium]